MPDHGSVEVDKVPELASDEEGRPIRSSREPERYDPSTGCSCAQMEACHNIAKQSNEPKVTLDYTEEEVQVVASIITQLKAKCNAQQYMLKRGLKEFPIKGAPAAKEELMQMHDRKCFKAIAVAELTRQERVRAQEGLMILNEKRSGRIKGRLAYNGKATREWITKEDKSSPTVLTESIKLTAAVDAYEERDVASMDIPNAFIQTILPPRPDEERVIMKIRGKLVDWLLEIDPTEYASLVVMERGVKVLYLHILRAIYGMIEAILL